MLAKCRPLYGPISEKTATAVANFATSAGAHLPNGWDIIEVPYMIINSPPIGELEKS